MKILVNCLVVVIAAGAGLGLGFALRGKKVPDAAANSPVATAAATTVSSAKSIRGSNSPGPVRAHDDSPLTTKLARDLSMSTGVTRWLYWLEAIEKAAPADFPRL